MADPTLFPAALAGVHVASRWAYPGGWRVTVLLRREGDEAVVYEAHYEDLSTAEMFDVIEAELDGAKQLSGIVGARALE